MTREFYRIKQVCDYLNLKSATSLRKKIARGILPPLEHPFPHNARVAGYSAETLRSVVEMALRGAQSVQHVQSGQQAEQKELYHCP